MNSNSSAARRAVFKLRLVTALILVLILLAVLLLFPSWVFIVFSFSCSVLSMLEWSRLCLSSRWHSLLWTVFVATLSLLLFLFLSPDWWYASLWWAMVWWSLASMLILYCVYHESLPKLTPWFWRIGGILTIAPAWLGLMWLHTMNRISSILFLFAFIATIDTCSYLVGSRMGKRTCVPVISPNKTWEGLAGGISAGMLLAIIYAAVAWPQYWDYFGIFLFSGATVIMVMMVIMGDLVESLFKRSMGKKDSGSLLPGHGGILDRLDSFFAATPCFVLLISIID